MVWCTQVRVPDADENGSGAAADACARLSDDVVRVVVHATSAAWTVLFACHVCLPCLSVYLLPSCVQAVALLRRKHDTEKLAEVDRLFAEQNPPCPEWAEYREQQTAR